MAESNGEELLVALSDSIAKTGWYPERARFRIDHEDDLDTLDQLEQRQLIRVDSRCSTLTLAGLKLIAPKSSFAQEELHHGRNALAQLKTLYRTSPEEEHKPEEVVTAFKWSSADLFQRALGLLSTAGATGTASMTPDGRILTFRLREQVLKISPTIFDWAPSQPASTPESPAPAALPPARPKAARGPKADYGDRWLRVKDQPPGLEGGQARVYVVEDVRDRGTRYALKELKRIDDPARVARFKREIEILRSLDHPNIVKVHDDNLDARNPYFVMDYVKAGSIEKNAARLRRDPTQWLGIFEKVCEGMAAAHAKNIVHRDLKPENILLRDDDEPVVADFGLCHVVDGDRHTATSEVVGARWYVAPELRDGRAHDGEITARCDVYSLGKVLYNILADDIFDREDHRRAKYDLRTRTGDETLEHVSELLDRMICESPGDRLADARAVAAEVRTLRRLVAGRYGIAGGDNQLCTFCGVGRYQRMGPGFIGLPPLAGGSDVRVLWCKHCGNVQLFRVDKTTVQWPT